jgi:hypothetical protein
MDIKFIEYKLTPGEKHLGIVTILFDNKIFLRYRISEGKDGKGMFPSPASYRITEGGVDSYLPAFVIDSRMLHEQIMTIIKQGIHESSHKPEIKHVASIHEEFGDCPF